jgi:hypothetical protein
MMLYVAVEGDHPLRRSSTLATLAAVLDEPLPAPVRAGRLTPVLAALLARDPAARPDAGQLDRMLAEVESPPGFGGWPPADTSTRVLGVRAPADHTPAPHPPVPPGGTAVGATRPTRPAHGNRVTVGVLSGAVVVLAGALVCQHTGQHATGNTTPTSAGAKPVSGASDAPAPAQSSPPDDLLTPAGLRATVRAITPYTDGGKVKDLVVYPGYAVVEAPPPGHPKVYDDLDYRGGQVTHSPGGTMDSDDGTVALGGYDWSVLPKLLAEATKDLKVPHPNSRYVVIGPDLFDGSPTIDVYLSNDYGGGYLSADAKGRILHTYPFGS